MKFTLVFLLSLISAFSFAEDLKVEYVKVSKAPHAVAKKMSVAGDDYYQFDVVAKEVLDFCKSKGLEIKSPPFAHGAGSRETPKGVVYEIEVGYEVAKPLAKKEGDFYPLRTPSGNLAVHTYVGPYENEGAITAQLERQLEAQGKKIEGSNWDYYPNSIKEVPKEKLITIVKYAYKEKPATPKTKDGAKAKAAKEKSK